MNNTERMAMPDLFNGEGMYNPYNFQVQDYDQVPEDIAIEILAGTDALEIADVPITVINDWLEQEKELWACTEKVVYE